MVENTGKLPIQSIAVRGRLGECINNISDLLPGQTMLFPCEVNEPIPQTRDEYFFEVFAAGDLIVDGRFVQGVFDTDLIGYSNSSESNANALLNITSMQQSIPAGGDATFRVSVAATGNAASVNQINSDQINCQKTYSSPLTTGQYDVYDCTAANVESDLTVNVELVSTGGAGTITITDSATVIVENR